MQSTNPNRKTQTNRFSYELILRKFLVAKIQARSTLIVLFCNSSLIGHIILVSHIPIPNIVIILAMINLISNVILLSHLHYYREYNIQYPN